MIVSRSDVAISADPAPQLDGDGDVVKKPYPQRQGAGLYGFLGMPEPVIYAELNRGRSIYWAAFERAAEQRFRLLDTNGYGALARVELPRLPQLMD